MGTAFLCNRGNGSASLNFRVLGGTSEPSSPKENDIWVNTDTEITSWLFSATEPDSPVEGMVWVKTGATSPVAFNALKKNSIMVYPLDASQFISGAWSSVDAKSCIGGEWVDWVFDIAFYENGEFNTEVFGTPALTNCTNSGGVLTFKQNGSLVSGNAYDISAFNSVKVNVADFSWGNMTLSILNESSTVVASVAFSVTGTTTLDISALTGLHYLKLFCQANSTSDYTAIDSIRLVV